ncbi:MAG TPA: group II intron reverse transcriptase/maturase, partial [Xanthomonadales bacterium]|nr:group II intron reverse transcriptase/maturase [Xanthomonadales bacterium]
QTRIAKAAKAQQWRRVQCLQRLLVRSTTAKAVAVRRVTENQGRKTPGVDGVTWSTPTEKRQAMDTLNTRGYRPKPLRRIHIPKANGGKRPLGIPTMRDRAMQALHWLALDPVAETLGDVNSYGFRTGRSTADALAQCRNALGRPTSPQWILEGDIKGCFDNISHDWLMKHVPMDRDVLKKWLKAGFVEDRQLFPTEAGTPQGGIISPVLANMVLDGMEIMLDGLPRRAKVNFIRYADDFIVTADSKELLEAKVKPMIAAFLAERGLTLSETKTKITHVSEGFDFLGWTLRKRKQNGILLVTPSKKNASAFYEKVRCRIRALRGATQDDVIFALTPVIRGWGNYHRVAHASRTFAEMDHHVFHALWCWAKRRHPNKGKRWVKRRYFRRTGSRDWLFKTDVAELFRLSRIPMMVRYVKVRGDANPYDPANESYFDKRLQWRMSESLAGRVKLSKLWKKQEGRCAECGERMTSESGWHVHHVIWRTFGGTNDQANLRLLHPVCHVQLHARGSTG